MVNLIGSWLGDGLNSDEVARVNGILGVSFLESHRGYRLHRMLKEHSDRELEAIEGLFRIVARFSELGRTISSLTKEDAYASPYSIACLMFEYQDPVLRLSDADQQLLLAALKVQTDEELGAELNLSLTAIKKRWISIFDKIASVRPDLLDGLEPSESGRGRQKRHHVLSYIRAHPEELRPYAWPENQQKTRNSVAPAHKRTR